MIYRNPLAQKGIIQQIEKINNVEGLDTTPLTAVRCYAAMLMEQCLKFLTKGEMKMTGKVVNGIYFKNLHAAAANDITEKVYKNSNYSYDLEKVIDKYREQLQPEFDVVIQSEVKSK